MFDKKIFGTRIREYRKALNMSVKELAHEFDISYAYLSDIEQGHDKPSVVVAVDMLNYFNTNFTNCLSTKDVVDQRNIKIDFIIGLIKDLDKKDIEFILKTSELLSN